MVYWNELDNKKPKQQSSNKYTLGETLREYIYMAFNNIKTKHDLECLPNKSGLQKPAFFVLRAL